MGLLKGFGVGFLPEHSPDEAASFFRAVENLGYHSLWVANEGLYRDTFVTLTHCAEQTQCVALGTAVLDPYTRHPGRMALSAATLDEICDGRIVIGLGAGGSATAVFGQERQSPVGTMRECVELMRAVWSADTSGPFFGQFAHMHSTKLEFEPMRDAIPIFIAARGPLLLELAGEVGDGALIGGFVSKQVLRWCRERIAVGATRAGRDVAEVQMVAWVYTSISDDAELARNAVRRLVTTSLLTSGPGLEEGGLELGGRLRDHFNRNEWAISEQVVEEAMPLVPDSILESLSMSGTPEDCARGLASLMESEIDHVVVLPFSTPVDDKFTIIRRFKEEVVPRVLGNTS